MFGFNTSFKSKYQAYKDAVLKRLSKTFTFTAEMQHDVESWIRDYFLDGIDVDECARAIRYNVHESIKRQEENKLLEARQVLKRNGYKLKK